MSAPYHNAEERVEDALKAYLVANLSSPTSALTIKVAFDFNETEPPFLSISCPRSVEDPPDTGTTMVTAILAMCSDKSTSRADHAAHFARACDLFYDAGLIGYLNGLSGTGLTFQQSTPGPRERRILDKFARVTSQEFTFMVSMS